MKVYKIRNKETGMYKHGGHSYYSEWSKKGKTWSSLGNLKNHMRIEYTATRSLGNDPKYDSNGQPL